MAPTKHSLPEARGWLCMHGCAGRDALTSPGKSSVLGRAKLSSKQQELQVVAPGGA